MRKLRNENAIISRHCHQRALYDAAGRDHALLLPGGESLDGRAERGAGEGRRIQKTHRTRRSPSGSFADEAVAAEKETCRQARRGVTHSMVWKQCGAAFLQNGSTNIRFGERKENSTAHFRVEGLEELVEVRLARSQTTNPQFW